MVANLTITVDDQVLRRARIRALEQGTSVNAILSEYLTRFARVRDQQKEAVGNLLALAKKTSAQDKARAKRRGGRAWTRSDLYE